MRRCAFCGESIEGRRPQARYCCSACRAAASRVRASDWLSEAHRPVGAAKPHTKRTAGHRQPIQERRASRAEEKLFQRLRTRYPEMWEARGPVPVGEGSTPVALGTRRAEVQP